MDENEPLLSAKQIAAKLGTTGGTILQWYHAGVIPAEIAEGGTYRFNLEVVREALRRRAEAKSATELDRVARLVEANREYTRKLMTDFWQAHREERDAKKASIRAAAQKVKEAETALKNGDKKPNRKDVWPYV